MDIHIQLSPYPTLSKCQSPIRFWIKPNPFSGLSASGGTIVCPSKPFANCCAPRQGPRAPWLRLRLGGPNPGWNPAFSLGCLPSWKLASGRGGFFYFIILLIFFYRFNTQKQILQTSPLAPEGGTPGAPPLGARTHLQKFYMQMSPVSF